MQTPTAVQITHWSNDDGSVHVAEMTIEDALFHMHEEVSREEQMSPKTPGGTTVIPGLFVDDPHSVVEKQLQQVLQKPTPYRITIMITAREILQILSGTTRC
ncbi:MAG TPA: hypothetical protein PLP23_07805 [Panacibacter sp.]|nr:hypothetical protein [Panacibacter sp.]